MPLVGRGLRLTRRMKSCNLSCMTTETPPVGTNIRRLRESKGLRTADLAVAAGTLQRNVQRWERGEVVPSWTLMVRVSDALEVEPFELWVQA